LWGRWVEFLSKKAKDMPQGEVWEFVASLCDIYGRA